MMRALRWCAVGLLACGGRTWLPDSDAGPAAIVDDAAPDAPIIDAGGERTPDAGCPVQGATCAPMPVLFCADDDRYWECSCSGDGGACMWMKRFCFDAGVSVCSHALCVGPRC